MKKSLLIIIIQCFASLCLYGQSSDLGGPFTPRGDIRFLVIFAGFEKDCDATNDGSIWPNVNVEQNLPPCKTLPLYYKDLFYSDFDQFKPEAQDKTISNFYYQMSRHHPTHAPLRIVGDIFPERINIEGSSPNNTAVFKKIQDNFPDFDWSRYDNRKNYPNFRFDNSITEPDHIIDYVVIMWRQRGAGGYANTNSFTFVQKKNGVEEKYQMHSACGFTATYAQADNLGMIAKIFHHELAHTLFNCPHLFYANGVSGDYFYASNGWGTMSYGYINCSANAWESWYNGWIELDSTNDLKGYSQNGIYKLRDFVTTGDAIRIKLPFVNQYLWIENHSGLHSFDNREEYETDAKGNPIPDPDRGLFMFVERITDKRSELISPLSFAYCNGLKALHNKGNYDYKALSDTIDPQWWNNRVVDFEIVEANPTSAHNNIALIRGNYDYEKDYPEKIVYKNFTNNRFEGSSNCKDSWKANISQEANGVLKINGGYTYDDLGIHMAFGSGSLPQKIGISSNPVIINHQKYVCPDRLEPIYLNGISINILSRDSNGTITFEVRFDDTEIVSDQRFTGDLILKDIPNSKYDLNVTSGNTLIINKSGTPNRYNQGEKINGVYEFPDFINPSIMTIDSGAVIFIADKGKMIIREGTTLRIKPGAEFHIKGKGKLIIEKDGYLCVEEGAIIKMEKGNKNLKLKGSCGVNSKLKLTEEFRLKDVKSFFQ